MFNRLDPIAGYRFRYGYGVSCLLTLCNDAKTKHRHCYPVPILAYRKGILSYLSRVAWVRWFVLAFSYTLTLDLAAYFKEGMYAWTFSEEIN